MTFYDFLDTLFIFFYDLFSFVGFDTAHICLDTELNFQAWNGETGVNIATFEIETNVAESLAKLSCIIVLFIIGLFVYKLFKYFFNIFKGN